MSASEVKPDLILPTDEQVERACANTGKELWRGPADENGDTYYADSIHVTQGGGIGIDCGGHVIVLSLRAWRELARINKDKILGEPAPQSALMPPYEYQKQEFGSGCITMSGLEVTKARLHLGDGELTIADGTENLASAISEPAPEGTEAYREALDIPATMPGLREITKRQRAMERLAFPTEGYPVAYSGTDTLEPSPLALTDQHVSALERAIRAEGFDILSNPESGEIKLVQNAD